MMRRFVLYCGLVLWLPAAECLAQTQPAAGEPDRAAIAMEALSRLKGMDLEANPAVKTAVMKVLESTRGTPNFARIVQDFQIKGQQRGLLEVAVKNPNDGSGAEAMRLLLAEDGAGLIKETLIGSNVAAAVNAAECLGDAADKRGVPLLLPLVTDTARDVAVRKQAVRSLARTEDGAAGLLALAREDKLPADVKFTAGMELNNVRWPQLKAEAAKVLPPPPGRNTQPLPPLAELLKTPGDASNGARVFARDGVGCIKCHRVNDQGKDVGPALSEIGTKLGKDALYEAILDPSAGIASGYEAWQLELKSGDEAYGIIASETADELTIKDANAISTRIKKSDIVKRQQMKLSMMPAGLQQTMSTQELVDLVEYLASLKKAEK
jgi:putative heme-binding domain-containing protein